MSETSNTRTRFGWLRQRRNRRDDGMTLPEVTISVAITGIVVATLSMTTTVILRQMDNTEGRTNNARSEQSVSLFMPTDLSSAETVTTAAADLPCGPTTTPPSPACPPGADVSGSSALMLTWTGTTVAGGVAVDTVTRVSYRVTEVSGEYRLIRVECFEVLSAAPTISCNSTVVLRNLEPPPAGTEWIPGVTPPSWVMTVSQAAAADDTSGPDVTAPVDPGLRNKNAQRVVVTINGGGDVTGAGGGQNQISLSAGGTNRETNLTTDDLVGAPTFTAARTRCGGNFGVIVDKSGSIGSTNMATVRTGVKQFITSFAGTPVKIQVVAFSATADTLGAGAGWTKYYDMLIESDVTDLSALVDGVSSGGGTNWEDGFFRMLKNSDGTVQAQLPNTILFFTDGVPTRSRLDYSSATAPAVADPLDGGLSGTDGSSFYQVGWNRTERLIRDRGSINLIGVYVNTNTEAQSTWTIAGAGYHTDYQKANEIVFEQGSPAYERGNTVIWQQGTTNYQRGNTVVYERGSRTTYDRNNNVTFQYANSGIAWERYSGGSWVSARSGYSSTSTQARDRYFSNNTVAGESDGYRARVVTTLGSWSTMTLADYEESNLSAGNADGFQSVASTSGGWTAITQAQFDLSNTTATDTDGWRTSVVYTSPFTTWSSTTQATYEASNTTSAETDGWRTRATATPTTWTNMTLAQYNASNTTSTEADGWRINTTWANITQGAYNTGNTVSGETDLFRTALSGTVTSWTTIALPEYTASNTTGDSADGFRASTGWATVPQATYDTNNTNNSESDGWRARVTGAITGWNNVTLAQYNASNSSSGESDGWRAFKVYSEPYTNHDAAIPSTIKDYSTIGNLVVGDTSGSNPGPYAVAIRETGFATPYTFTDDGGDYTNAAVADLFVLPDYSKFGAALTAVALDQCGGTVTLQTKLGSASAQDPFTYENTTTHEVVKTSALYRSGTFDVALPGGGSTTVTISPQDFTNLTHYSPAGWSCKSAGVAYPFTVVPVVGHAPWTAIQLTVNPNQAVSCVQQVSYS